MLSNSLRISAAMLMLAGMQTTLEAADDHTKIARPNVIIFIADDVSWNDYGCYGNAAARTPNIDQLATHGIRFDQAFLTASSCSPSRSSIITGRYPHNNGKAAELHAPISSHLPWFPELLRSSGYYTALSGKNHMRAVDPSRRPKAFDHIDGGRTKNDTSGSANWVKITKERPKHKPFFFWFASFDAHRGWDADKQWKSEYGPKHDWRQVVVPPFLIDDEISRRDLASYYNEVTRFDYRIGEVTRELDRQGVLDQTLIFVLADNGRPFPRAKTRLHDSGMKTCLVAHWPLGIDWSGASDQLVSVIDLAPTILEVADCEVPGTMQGVSMAPLFRNSLSKSRSYAFSEHNWHDYEAFGRSVRDGRYLYLFNGRTQLPWQGPADSVRSDSHLRLQNARDNASLTDAQADVFRSPRPATELYLLSEDPYQLKNLAGDPKHQDAESHLAAILDRWMAETGDSLPTKLTPDQFDRTSGKRLPKSSIDLSETMTPGEDRGADRINAPGPR